MKAKADKTGETQKPQKPTTIVAWDRISTKKVGGGQLPNGLLPGNYAAAHVTNEGGPQHQKKQSNANQVQRLFQRLQNENLSKDRIKLIYNGCDRITTCEPRGKSFLELAVYSLCSI